jgi:hypothetical protein
LVATICIAGCKTSNATTESDTSQNEREGAKTEAKGTGTAFATCPAEKVYGSAEAAHELVFENAYGKRTFRFDEAHVALDSSKRNTTVLVDVPDLVGLSVGDRDEPHVIEIRHWVVRAPTSSPDSTFGSRANSRSTASSFSAKHY